MCMLVLNIPLIARSYGDCKKNLLSRELGLQSAINSLLRKIDNIESEVSNPSLVLVHPRKICPYITERLLIGCKESNQTNKQTKVSMCMLVFNIPPIARC